MVEQWTTTIYYEWHMNIHKWLCHSPQVTWRFVEVPSHLVKIWFLPSTLPKHTNWLDGHIPLNHGIHARPVPVHTPLCKGWPMSLIKWAVGMSSFVWGYDGAESVTYWWRVEPVESALGQFCSMDLSSAKQFKLNGQLAEPKWSYWLMREWL